MNAQLSFPLTGYLLLPPDKEFEYRGVDRNPFQPSLLNEEMDLSAPVEEGETHVWSFYPPGWRRDAYRLYEQNTVEETKDNILDLVSNVEAARQIQKLILPHVGPHEIVECHVWCPDTARIEALMGEGMFLGFDAAYFGGDLFSAVRNGLFVNPDEGLYTEYGKFLTEFGLFRNAEPIPEYIRRFKQVVQSESDSKFCIYQLNLVTD